MKLSRNARITLQKRYLKRDETGRLIEEPEDMFRRVSKTVASAELKYGSPDAASSWDEEFYQMMTRLEFLPNSPTLLNAGQELGLLSSCFVLPVEDSIDGISRTVREAMLIQQYGGGTGYSFSSIRPEGDFVAGYRPAAGGPVKLINVFSESANYIRQAGVRCGCNAASLPVTHPDIMNFIKAKSDGSCSANFATNISITDDFIEKVRRGDNFSLVNPRNGAVTGELSAREVFTTIAQGAWSTGDPGIIFIDRIKESNPTPHLGAFDTTDPCGGQLLLPYESATLGTINLSLMVKRDQNGPAVDFDRLAGIIPKAVRFLDDALDVNRFPFSQVENAALATRKIGLGFMGFAEMLMQLGIPYNSEEALSVADQLMRFFSDTVRRSSEQLAQERGAFPAFPGSIYDHAEGKPIRNASCVTFTNTGTTSIIANTSSGIHPIYSLVMVRNILDGERLLDINEQFERTAREHGFFSRGLVEKLLAGESPQDCLEIPQPHRRILATAKDIEPEWCIRMQSIFQRYTDNAVSQTVNFPKEATVDDIANLFLKAHELGIKGITAYRDTSRDVQVLCTGDACLDVIEGYFNGDLK
ncbi:adenosylcobalamin-dependent ribonucleoside-diphosphate reductase [Dehalogenimonas sp. THU2]|uniref:adenosylcobalamin-dependent ribonucleoside-diphosphate reductase n=1 Tax=Dehalogenimonas sp. THU2 TaxID=3151121 RepID=UPI0032183AF5